MYESPLELVCTDIVTKITKETDDMIYSAVQQVYPNINKEELVKALEYDRHQYEKGYDDGYMDALNRVTDIYRQLGTLLGEQAND